MRTMMFAALAAAQLPAAAAAAELPREERARHAAVEALRLPAGEREALRAAGETGSREAEAAREDRPRKRKSTGDKILTGAAVVLGVGALAVAGLMVAIFVD